MLGATSDYQDMGKRVALATGAPHLDVRKKIVDGHKDYAQILPTRSRRSRTLPKRHAQINEFCRMINDGFAELCAKEADHFPGWVAQISLDAPDCGVGEAERAVKELGALGVQIYTNVAGKPLDRPPYLPFWNRMNELGTPIWMHPIRGANMPDYIDERSRSTRSGGRSAGPSRDRDRDGAAGLLKDIDSHPNLKIITHHFGAIVPMLEGRIGPGWDVLGSRTTDEDYVALRKSLKKRPLDYFKQDFYADTAVFGAAPATRCGLEFLSARKGRICIGLPVRSGGRHAVSARDAAYLRGAELDRTTRDKIYSENLERITGRTLVK